MCKIQCNYIMRFFNCSIMKTTSFEKRRNKNINYCNSHYFRNTKTRIPSFIQTTDDDRRQSLPPPHQNRKYRMVRQLRPFDF